MEEIALMALPKEVEEDEEAGESNNNDDPSSSTSKCSAPGSQAGSVEQIWYCVRHTCKTISGYY